jgi:putative ABC transport system permease protein
MTKVSLRVWIEFLKLKIKQYMSEFRLIVLYSARIVIRQWRRFTLPFLSLFITATVLLLVLLVTQASTLLLKEQSRSLLGGDVVIESTVPFDSDAFWKETGVTPDKQSKQISFTAALQHDGESAPFSVKVVDEAYLLYGNVTTSNGTFRGSKDSEIYLDEAGARKLKAEIGDQILFGQKKFTLAGIISLDPSSLLAGFKFFPQALLSQKGFTESGIDPALLRSEYSYAATIKSLSSADIAKITSTKLSLGASEKQVRISIAGKDQQGLQKVLAVVSNFLRIALLITAVLSAVNVYASTLYFVGAERRNLAILLTLGLRKNALITMLFFALLYVLLLSSLVGMAVGVILFITLKHFVLASYLLLLPTPNLFLYSGICFTLVSILSFAAFLPATAKTLELSPRDILIGTENTGSRKSKIRSFLFIIISTLVPLTVFSSYLLGSFIKGTLIMLGITTVYIVLALLYTILLSLLYKKRSLFPFFIRSTISQKKADGFFGVVSFTSLFIALIAIGSLALIGLSIEKYVTTDLARTVPSTYILDVQPSQKDSLLKEFPDISLFQNIRARILSIDGLKIQDELAKENSSVDRELGREYNLTARQNLLSSESISKGVWGNGKSGEISVDEEFGKRVNITLGSTITFSIQGFEITGVVTSFRKTDTRSGLPFFYFILSPEDVAKFPAVYFGYSLSNQSEQINLSSFAARTMPNVSVLDTASIREQVLKIVQTLLLLIFIITIPPLLIAMLLIVMLVISNYESRRREGARLRALGATRAYILFRYLFETLSITLACVLLSYIFSVLISYVVTTYYLQFSSIVYFDRELLIGLLLLLAGIGLTALYLFKKDTMPLRELISYETNT